MDRVLWPDIPIAARSLTPARNMVRAAVRPASENSRMAGSPTTAWKNSTYGAI